MTAWLLQRWASHAARIEGASNLAYNELSCGFCLAKEDSRCILQGCDPVGGCVAHAMHDALVSTFRTPQSGTPENTRIGSLGGEDGLGTPGRILASLVDPKAKRASHVPCTCLNIDWTRVPWMRLTSFPGSMTERRKRVSELRESAMQRR